MAWLIMTKVQCSQQLIGQEVKMFSRVWSFMIRRMAPFIFVHQDIGLSNISNLFHRRAIRKKIHVSDVSQEIFTELILV